MHSLSLLARLISRQINLDSQKDVKSKKKEKYNDSGCIWTSGHEVTFLSAPFKTLNTSILNMFPAGSQVVLYLVPFMLFLVKYLSVFILLLYLESVCLIRSLVLHLFYIWKCPASSADIYRRVFRIQIY